MILASHCSRPFKRFHGVRFGSNSGDPYTGLLLKKLLFYIHPDYLAQEKYKTQRSVNQKNIQNVQSMVTEGAVPDGAPRALSFYLKPGSTGGGDGDDLRRVQVAVGSIAKIENSVLAILEALNADNIPQRPNQVS
jgi:hypothetical protein